ncbi:hypothetical protein [Miltoncostaea oceani]|uniref:hypothetical protein n=1 Tax=Miltoncostaea oceani TaxID=2843216 RepID=UPI001C3D47A2|nr:hypothetical protein [Miltoncostaea oceani]
MSDRNPYPPSPRRPADEPPDDILYAPLEVSAGEARDEELGLELHVTDAGALHARPLDPGEEIEAVISAGALTLSVLRGIDEVGTGDVVIPIVGDGDNAVVRQTLAHGTGAITLTAERLLGLVWQSTVPARSLHASVDDDGEGRVIAFSVRRDALDDIEVEKNFGRLRSATLTGAASCAVVLDTPLRILEGEEYVEGPKGVIEQELRAFVGREATGGTTVVGAAASGAATGAIAADVARSQPTEPLPPLGGRGDDLPPPTAPPGEGTGSSLPKWLLPAAAAVIAALAIGLGVLLLAGGDDEPTAAAGANTRGPSAEFVTAVTGPVRRLNRSAEITGRQLARTATSAHLARVSRTATQQLAVVQEQRGRVADLQVGRSRERVARGTLSRAIQAHRTYLTTLSRIDGLEAGPAREQFARLRSQSQRTLNQYRAFFALAPSLPQGVTSAGLADLSGVNDAIKDRKRIEDETAAEADRDERSGGGGGSGGDGGVDGGPVLSNVYGADLGSLIEVGAEYCDRTPGAVNNFLYTFEIRRGGATIAQDSYNASQTRACNSISMTFGDGFALGFYEVAVTVNNLTNNVSGSAVGSFQVVN